MLQHLEKPAAVPRRKSAEQSEVRLASRLFDDGERVDSCRRDLEPAPPTVDLVRRLDDEPACLEHGDDRADRGPRHATDTRDVRGQHALLRRGGRRGKVRIGGDLQQHEPLLSRQPRESGELLASPVQVVHQIEQRQDDRFLESAPESQLSSIGTRHEDDHRGTARVRRGVRRAIALFVVGMIGCGAPRATTPNPRAGRGLLRDLGVDELVALRCDREGREVVLAWSGDVYAVIPGERTRRLFAIRGMNIARCLRTAGAWHLVSRELMYYLDPDRESVLDRWDNPWTNERLPVVHVANRLVQNELRGGSEAIDDGTNVTVSIDVPLFYPNPLAETPETSAFSPQASYQAVEMFTLTAPRAAFADDSSSVSTLTLTWHRVGPWLPWMNMGARPGYLLYTARGAKIAGIDALDEPMRSDLRRLELFQHAPRCVVAAPNETSWTYFAKHLAEYRAGARFPLEAPADPSECSPRP